MFQNFRWFSGFVLHDELAEPAKNWENFIINKRLACYFIELKLKNL